MLLIESTLSDPLTYITVPSYGRSVVSNRWQIAGLLNSLFRLTQSNYQGSTFLALYGGNSTLAGGFHLKVRRKAFPYHDEDWMVCFSSSPVLSVSRWIISTCSLGNAWKMHFIVFIFNDTHKHNYFSSFLSDRCVTQNK